MKAVRNSATEDSITKKAKDKILLKVNIINPQNKPLTLDILKTFRGYENYSDEEALFVIDNIQKLAMLLYNSTFAKENIVIDNQQFISLESNRNSLPQKIAA